MESSDHAPRDRLTGMAERDDVAATFRHLDELEWQQVRAQRHADGSTRSVWDKWFVLSQDPPVVSLLTRWDPGVVVHRHGHHGHQVNYVIAGGMWCGERWCGPGTHIDLPLGAAIGPMTAGPDGVEIFEVTFGDGRSWEADRAGFEALLAERQITPLPNPPIALPDWLPDRRSTHE